MSVLRTGRGRAGGGGGGIFNFFPTKFVFKNVPGVLKRMQKKKNFGGGGDFGVFGAPHAPTRGSRGVGKRYTSSYDHDMWPVKILERSGLAVKSYHPETLAAEEEQNKKFWQNHKAFPAGSRECLINLVILLFIIMQSFHQKHLLHIIMQSFHQTHLLHIIIQFNHLFQN